MRSIFNLCKELEFIDLTNFNTSKVIEMSWMFSECYKLKEIKGINNLNTKMLKIWMVFLLIAKN